eukprot:CAMPEP_0175851804 /NCGR_PEP_ID=MMETSP0107_2-20121207/25865_1 /TAXON_ID=195067 ORGANISM="Goniomonas pacifica, Strain CCMP1869" /NCGR_SAMPLE_ID=MMETSP0107_2 /ASSEMBLY_ACC=CAM_ASM_000203 /LENGTH=47 /DNA_ID= /DNA_START= /DNA_END= /DNA_ORIENTATION=
MNTTTTTTTTMTRLAVVRYPAAPGHGVQERSLCFVDVSSHTWHSMPS